MKSEPIPEIYSYFSEKVIEKCVKNFPAMQYQGFDPFDNDIDREQGKVYLKKLYGLYEYMVLTARSYDDTDPKRYGNFMPLWDEKKVGRHENATWVLVKDTKNRYPNCDKNSKGMVWILEHDMMTMAAHALNFIKRVKVTKVRID